MEPLQFIAAIAPDVVAEMNKFRILASVTLAQAILESGWGRSRLATEANNLFGIKGTGPAGSVTIETIDYDGNGVAYRNVATFRKYHTWQESIQDHTQFLVTSTRYQNLIGEVDYRIACQKVQEDGYTDDPNYVTQLLNIIARYKLDSYDKQMTPTTKDPIGMLTVITEGLNVRKGPSMQDEVIRVIKKGETYAVRGAAVNGFYPIGTDEWCSANPLYVSFQATKKPIGTVTLLTDVNLRKGPGTTFPIIRVLPKGTSYPVLDSSNGFYTLGTDEWCTANAAYVSFFAYTNIKVTTQSLNVRKGPGVSYAIVRQVGQNDICMAQDFQKGWYQIGVDEWVSGGYVVRI